MTDRAGTGSDGVYCGPPGAWSARGPLALVAGADLAAGESCETRTGVLRPCPRGEIGYLTAAEAVAAGVTCWVGAGGRLYADEARAAATQGRGESSRPEHAGGTDAPQA